MFSKGRTWVLLAGLLLGLAILQQFWHWEVERIEVPPGHYLVQVRKLFGTDLAQDEIVAPDTSHKGVTLDTLTEGRHFLNPIIWSYEIHKAVEVPPGQCLVLTRNYGHRISPERANKGEIIAAGEFPVPEAMRGKEERGIVRNVLQPGSYRLNPHAYSWTLAPAVEVKVDQVGVRTLKVGDDPSGLKAAGRKDSYTVPDGFRGIQETPVGPGTYYINPFIESIATVNVRSHRVELEDIEFPSRDGFILKPHVVVEYAVQPAKAPEMMVRLMDVGVLNQEDSTPEQQATNQILQKVILPNIRGYARIEGSNFDARDFIVTDQGAAKPATAKTVNTREALRKALESKVTPRCAEHGVELRSVTLSTLVPPPELAEQIRQREIALVELAKNKVKVGQFQAMQELKAKEGLKQQAKEKVEAETKVLQAKTKAMQDKQIEESRLKQDLMNATVGLEAAKLKAQSILAKGEGEAGVIRKDNEAEIAGLRMAAQSFPSPQLFAQYHILARIAPALTEVFASDDSEFARLLTGYLTPNVGSSGGFSSEEPKPASQDPSRDGSERGSRGSGVSKADKR